MDNINQSGNALLSGALLNEPLVVPLDGHVNQGGDTERGKKRFYGFRLNDMQLLLDTNIRSEMINDAVITSLPLMPPYITGLCNVRGNLVPVYDMHKKLGLEEISSDSGKKKILVLGENENMAGIEIESSVVSLEFDEQDIQREVFSDNHQLNQCVSYGYQQNGSNWFGFEYKKLFNIVA